MASVKKKKSRTTNTILNFISSIGGQFLTIVMQFVVRTVFIHVLGKSYLGISSLFSNILSMLSLAEFGVGNAILFKLYEPVAKEDHHRIRLLMKFYRTVYRMIGFFVLIIGLCLIPFLPFLIKNYDKLVALNINAGLIFILYLLQSVSSYLFFAYKSSIIKVNQQEYIISIISYFVTLIGSIFQIICLYLFQSFTLYVVILILQIILQNYCTARIADRQYPYINDKTDESISTDEIKGIVKDCGALFLYRLNGVVLKATDNIVISSILGLDHVALYSNYYVFYHTINTLFNKLFDSVVHSLGNLHTDKNLEHEYQVFETANLITAILGSTAGVGIFVVSDEFVRTWIGNDWVIASPFALLMGIELFTLSYRQILSRYRNAMGLFQQAKWRPLAGMIINLVASIVLVKYWGICGVLAGTIIADWSTFMWFDPLIINKYGFKQLYSVKRYYFKFIQYFAFFIVIAVLNNFICTHFFVGYGWFSVIIHALICGISVPAVILILFYKTNEGKYLFSILNTYKKKMDKVIHR